MSEGTGAKNQRKNKGDKNVFHDINFINRSKLPLWEVVNSDKNQFVTIVTGILN